MIRNRCASFLGGAFVATALAATCVPASAAEPALLTAARNQDRAGVVSLLAEGSDVNGPGPDGVTALHFAAEQDDLELAAILLQAGARTNAATRTNITPLSLAAQNGSAAMLELFLEQGADPNERSAEGQTAVMLAARNGRPEAIALLIEHGADLNVTEPFRGQTALMWAAGEGNAAAVALLLEHGATIDSKSTAGFTPLLFAVRNAELETLRVLLEHGANADAVGPDGTSALNMAVVNAYYEVASLLLAHGANPNLPDPRGSPLHTLAWLRKPGATGQAAVGAEAEAPPRPSGRVTSLELAQQLLAAGANPNVRIDWQEQRFDVGGAVSTNPPDISLGRHLVTYNGASAFYIAAKNGDAALMRILAGGGADPTLPNRFGVTPLMVAAGLDTWEGETPGPHVGVSEAERLEAVKLAVELGNDVNARADFGDYPMIGEPAYTLIYYPLNIKDLVDLGVGDPRWDDCTALHGSIIANQPSITQYLIDQGADVDARNSLGWTPLMMSRGIFLANASREFPAAEAILLQAMRERGLTADEGPRQ